MTIKDLAKAVGLSATEISYLEADKNKATVTNLRRLAEYLSVPVSFLGSLENLPALTLGQRITKARLFHGLTKVEMAFLLGVDPKTLNGWERSKHEPLEHHLTALNEYITILD